MNGPSLVAIFLHRETAGPMVATREARVEAGRGLEGDTYFLGPANLLRKSGPDREVTLIEAEALESLEAEQGIALEQAESRRNLVTRGVALNPLVGREFRVGEVRLKGIRLCEPCAHLERLTYPGVLKGLVHRGGLRAQVLEGGTIRVGDPVVA